MKRKIKSLIGFTIGATNGEIGKVKDFYFDDKTWTIRYLIVETGSWMFNRKILLSPEALLKPDWERKIFQVDLTVEQIKNSPDIDTDKPVSRQHEMELYSYYPWNTYWGGGLWAGSMGTSGMITPSTMPFDLAIHNKAGSNEKEEDNDPHLRSTDKVIGYNIRGTDGEIGNAEDFILNDINWVIDFMEVDTGNWFPGKKVLISPILIKEINWNESEVIVKASVAKIKNSPEYFPDQLLTEDYVTNLHNYYYKVISHDKY